MPESCAGVSLAVAMAFRAKAVVVAKAFHAKAVVVAKAFRAKAVRVYRAVAKACAPKLCTVERMGQELEAKIGIVEW